MSLEQFVAKYLGKQVEYHSYSANAKFQCVDLANQYITEVLHLTPLIGTNAKDFPEKIDKSQFDWIENTPDGIPQEGDIPVWNGRVGGGAGHIAIALKDCTINNLKSFDQNWSKPLYCTTESHTYTNVRGWLRSKKSDTISDMDSNPKIDFGGFQTVLETYKVIELNTLKSQLLAKDQSLFNYESNQKANEIIISSQNERILQFESDRAKDQAELEKLRNNKLGFFATLGNLIDRYFLRSKDVAKGI